jgi:hypothetical protein
MKIAIEREQSPSLFEILSSVSNLRKAKIAIEREQSPSLFEILSSVSKLREAKRILLCVLILAGVISCDDMESIHQQYLDMAERVYLGKVDSLQAFPGKERIKLTWYVNSDPKIKETVIYWNQRRDSVIKTFTRTTPGVQKDSVTIENLSGDYLFELFNRNGEGDYSLTETIPAVAYSAEYAEGLNKRPISSMSVTAFDEQSHSQTVKIGWGTPGNLCIQTRLTYTRRSSGEVVSITVENEETETILEDVGNRLEDPVDLIRVSSRYVPVQGAIDFFDSPVFTEQVVSYSASGVRYEYTNTDVLSSTNPYSNNLKTLRKMADNIWYLDKMGPYGVASNTLVRLEIGEDHVISVSGYYTAVGNLISDTNDASSVDPATGILDLKYRQIAASSGAYRVMEETLTPR